MIKRVMAGFLGGLMFLALPSSARALAVEPANDQTFDLPCQAAILVDEDSGTVLYEKNADEQRPIASITKVMTLLLTFEAMEAGKISREDTVPVSEHAYSMGGSQIWLEPGEEMTLDDMLKAICISSANDAAVAVAEYVGGSEGAFVSMMNEKAAALGMDRTHFENACGLDSEGHLSTARDVATMSREVLLHHPEVEDYCMIWSDSLRGGETQLVNTNKLLRRYTGITGLKTGTTGKAGVCISASAERDGLRLVAVVLGAASSEDRFDAATALLDYGFAHYESAAAPMPERGAAVYRAGFLPCGKGRRRCAAGGTFPAGAAGSAGPAGADYRDHDDPQRTAGNCQLPHCGGNGGAGAEFWLLLPSPCRVAPA